MFHGVLQIREQKKGGKRRVEPTKEEGASKTGNTRYLDCKKKEQAFLPYTDWKKKEIKVLMGGAISKGFSRGGKKRPVHRRKEGFPCSTKEPSDGEKVLRRKGKGAHAGQGKRGGETLLDFTDGRA